MANAVLIYTGSVCSTPMVEYARLTHEVFVPVYEHFDLYRLKELGETAATGAALVADSLGALYRRQGSAFLDTQPLKDYRRGAAVPTVEQKPHVFFKWRPFGEGLPGGKAIRDIFAANDVVPALMLRRSVAQQALKVHLSETHYETRHVQFHTAKMSEAEYADFVAEQDKVRIVLTEGDVGKIRTLTRDLVLRTRKALERGEFYFPSTRPMKAVVCEDIFDPVIDRESYLRTMQALLGAPVSFGETPHPKIRKAGLNPEHCANPELALEDEAVRGFETEYRELLEKLDRISAAASGNDATMAAAGDAAERR